MYTVEQALKIIHDDKWGTVTDSSHEFILNSDAVFILKGFYCKNRPYFFLYSKKENVVLYADRFHREDDLMVRAMGFLSEIQITNDSE